VNNIFIIPKGLSAGVVNSQIVEMVFKLNVLDNKENYIIVHKSDIKKISNPDAMYDSLFFYLIKQVGIDNIYIRSIFDFITVFFLKIFFFRKYTIIYDFRGIINEESYLRNKSAIRKQILFKIEKFIYNKADRVHTVSNNLKKYLIDNFGYRSVNVIPCSVSTNLLKKVKNKDCIDFVYLGSTAVWQKFEETIKLYGFIEKRLENSKLTIVTLNQNEAKKIVEKYKIINFEIKSLNHQEVLQDLKNYDFGFLLRDDNIVNNTASPIKFLEYVSNGVIPIMTDSVGDYSKLVLDEKIGIILKKDLKIDIKDLEVLLDDEHIHQKMKAFTDKYLWHNVLNDFFE